MADDAERAAKAARAKALLKKRQQQKTGVTGLLTPSSLPHSIESPTSASVLFGGSSDPVVDFGEFGVIKNTGEGTHEIPLRAATHLFPTSPPPATHNGEEPVDKLRALVENQKQTISLLVNEKASLTAQLDRLEDLENKSARNEDQLVDERKRTDGLLRRVRELEDQARVMGEQLEEVTKRERDTNDKSREQDRMLELARRSAGELKAQLELRSKELRELKEQIEADDRAETLERSLQSAQDRAEELAIQLSKAKQAHLIATKERDSLAEELKASITRGDEWKTRYTTLEGEAAELKQDHTERGAVLAAAERTREQLQQELAERGVTLANTQQERAHAISELAIKTQALHVAQASAADATRLQIENAELLAQLEEVRPKVIELSNKAAEDEERIWAAEGRTRAVEATVAALEAELEERRREMVEYREKSAHFEDEQKVEGSRMANDLRDVQDAYLKVTQEFERAKEHIAALEKEHSTQRTKQQSADRNADRWKARAEELQAEADGLQSQLREREQEAGDTLAVVSRTQSEVEGLRDLLALREDELARLRESPSDSRPSSPHRGDLSSELLSAARQQHALDLSTAHSRIRGLETDVFEAQAQTHAAQKRVAMLTDELSKLRNLTPPPDSRRTSLSVPRPHTPFITPRPVYDGNLSEAMRHKREVGLSMLRARIERERVAASPPETEEISLVGGSEGRSSSSPSQTQVKGYKGHSRYLDESHVFWCHSCRGDLVVL